MPFETIDARTAAVDIEMDTYLQHEPATEIISESNGTVKESAFPTHESPVTSELDAGSSVSVKPAFHQKLSPSSSIARTVNVVLSFI